MNNLYKEGYDSTINALGKQKGCPVCAASKAITFTSKLDDLTSGVHDAYLHIINEWSHTLDCDQNPIRS